MKMKYNKILFITLALFVLLFISSGNVSATHLIGNYVFEPSIPKNPGETATFKIIIDNTDGQNGIITFISTQPTKDINTKLTAPTISSKTISGLDNNVTFSILVPATPAGNYNANVDIKKDGVSVDGTLSYTLTVLSKAQFSTDISSLTISAQPDITKTGRFTITNTGSETLITAVTITGAFNDTKNNKITFDPISQLTINPGASTTVEVKAKIPSNQKVTAYTGKISITTDKNVNSEIPLTINVEPEICSDGRRSNGADITSASVGVLRIDIDEPDSGDDIDPGEEIQVKVNVENTGGDDLDVVVEAILYNLDENDEVETVESDSTEIKEDKDEDFNLVLKVPSDDSMDEKDDFAVIIKTFEDGDEDQNCNFDSVNIDFKRKSKDAIINNFLVEPSKAVCNSNVRFIVDVESIGKKEDDGVQIKILDSDLGLDLVSDIFTLAEFDESDNIARRSFTYLIPSAVKSGIYSIEAIVFFNNGKDSKSVFKNLDITCTGTEVTAGQGLINLLQNSFSAVQGKQFSVPVKINNPTVSSQTYKIELVTTGDWADTTSQQETVSAGQEQTVFLYPTIKTTAQTGSYTGNVNLKQGNTVLSTASFSVTVQQPSAGTGTTGGAVFQPTTGTSFFRDWVENGKIFWVLGIIVLILLIVLFIRLIFRK